MKNITLSLFVLGVAVANAGTVISSSSSSGSNNSGDLAQGIGAVTVLQPAGSAAAIAAQGGSVARGQGALSGAHHRHHGWEAECDEEDLEECHHDIHIQNAGSGASGDAVSN